MNRPVTLSPWLGKVVVKPRAKLRLFCFHYAGGGASVFREWPKVLPDDFEIYPVQMPARENRIREAAVVDAQQAVRELAQNLQPFFDKPFAFFGHSMGALLSHELTRLLCRHGGPRPAHLIVSGRAAPDQVIPRKTVHQLPHDEFIEEIRTLEGTPDSVLEHEELMELMVPVLRGDFQLCETYEFKPGKIDVPITAYGGMKDKYYTMKHIDAWGDQTTAAFKKRAFPGGHFFINDNHDMVMRALAMDCDAVVKSL